MVLDDNVYSSTKSEQYKYSSKCVILEKMCRLEQ